MFGLLAKAKRVAFWSVITLAVLWCLSFHSQWKVKNAIRRMEGRCLKQQETIFVAIVCRATYTASLLMNLYENASCPKRINVSVYEINDGCENSLAQYREKVNSSETGLTYEKNIHIMKRDMGDTGLYGALKELMTHGLKNEKFVCTLSECFVAESMWDARLLENLAPMTCLVMGSGYPYISGFDQDFPVFSYKESTVKTPSRFWTMNASFAPAQFWQGYSDQYLHAGNATEFLITCEATMKGWKFFHVPMSFDKTLRLSWMPKLLNSKAFKIKFAKLLEAMQVLPTLSKNSLIGVVDEQDNDEINTKFGSRSEYMYAINKMKI